MYRHILYKGSEDAAPPKKYMMSHPPLLSLARKFKMTHTLILSLFELQYSDFDFENIFRFGRQFSSN